jgi:hypothetical protein
MAATPLPRKLWEHPDPESTQMGQFRRELERSTGRKFDVSIACIEMKLCIHRNIS